MMTRRKNNAPVDEMLQGFIELSLTQHEALLYLEARPYNRAYMKIKKLVEELEARPGDQRHALIELFDHDNPQVRLNAAKHAHPLYPDKAIQIVQSIIDARALPQEVYAKDVLSFLMYGPRFGRR